MNVWFGGPAVALMCQRSLVRSSPRSLFPRFPPVHQTEGLSDFVSCVDIPLFILFHANGIYPIGRGPMVEGPKFCGTTVGELT